MKRLLVFSTAFVLCAAIAGCSSDTHEGLVSDTIQMIENATNKIDNIKIKVDEAVKRMETTRKLDFSDADEACKQLKEAGDDAQKLRQRIERVRAKISDDERARNLEKFRGPLNSQYGNLLKKKEELRTALSDAEKLGGNAKQAVKELRDKIIQAESPFEALSR